MASFTHISNLNFKNLHLDEFEDKFINFLEDSTTERLTVTVENDDMWY